MEEETSGGVLSKIPDRRDITKVWSYFTAKSSEIALASFRLIAGYIFDCIVFPLAVFILLLWLTRAMMRYVFEVNLQSSLREDLQGLLVREK